MGGSEAPPLPAMLLLIRQILDPVQSAEGHLLQEAGALRNIQAGVEVGTKCWAWYDRLADRHLSQTQQYHVMCQSDGAHSGTINAASSSEIL